MTHYQRGSRAVCIALCMVSASVCELAVAQSAGSTTVSVGWLHVAPQGNATPLTVERVGAMAVNQEVVGSGAHATSTDTVGITTEYFVTDHVGAAMLFGLPLKVDLVGDGTLQKYGNLGSTRPMPPALVFRYHFFSASAKCRPFIGLGVNYTWFTQVRATNSRFINDSFGPGGSAHATLSSSWNPVFEIGASYAASKHWSVGFALNYIPVKTNLTLYGQSATRTQIVSKSTLRLYPLSAFLNVAYTF